MPSNVIPLRPTTSYADGCEGAREAHLRLADEAIRAGEYLRAGRHLERAEYWRRRRDLARQEGGG